MRSDPPDAFTLIAAAATPVVAAALLAIVLLAAACDGLRPPGDASSPADAPSPRPSDADGAATSASGTPPSVSPGIGEPARRFLLVIGGPAAPRASVVHAGDPGKPSMPVQLPPDAVPLAALASDGVGRIAVVTQDARAWIAASQAVGAGGNPGWRPVGAGSAAGSLPGPVLGAAWSVDGSGIVLVAGAPGSGIRRTSVVTLRLTGGTPAVAELPYEADGPGIAALADGQVAVVVRDLRDRGALARVAPSGTVAVLPVLAQGVTAGGGLIALFGDEGVLIGDVERLRHGALPDEILPLDAGGGAVGAVAIASDGSAVAVVRLDPTGRASTVDVLRRAGAAWRVAENVGLDAAGGPAIPVWLP